MTTNTLSCNSGHGTKQSRVGWTSDQALSTNPTDTHGSTLNCLKEDFKTVTKTSSYRLFWEMIKLEKHHPSISNSELLTA